MATDSWATGITLVSLRALRGVNRLEVCGEKRAVQDMGGADGIRSELRRLDGVPL